CWRGSRRRSGATRVPTSLRWTPVRSARETTTRRPPETMLAAIYTQALFIVTDVAYLRGAGVVLAFVRAFLGRQRFVAFRMGWVEGTPCRCSSRVRLRRRAEISSTGAISRIGRATAQVLAPGARRWRFSGGTAGRALAP